MFVYWSPFGDITTNLDGETVGLLGERLRGHLPTVVQLPVEVFRCKRVRLHTMEGIKAHFEQPENRTKLMTPTDIGESATVPYMTYIPAE